MTTPSYPALSLYIDGQFLGAEGRKEPGRAEPGHQPDHRQAAARQHAKTCRTR